MSPEEHKAKAENLLETSYEDGVTADCAALFLAAAQVHATLALYRPEPITHVQVAPPYLVEAVERFGARRAGRRPQSENPPTDPSVTEKE